LRNCRIRFLLFVGLIAGALFYAPWTIAEGQEPTREQLQTQISILQDQIASMKEQADLYEKYKKAKEKEYDYQSKVMDFNIGTFHAQRIQTYVVMALVVIVVIAGVLFSAFQLWKSISTAGVQLNSEMEMSAKNVRITSSVVGIVVLVVSIAFLYIYTTQVYQMRPIAILVSPLEAPQK
jgi:hypothetical protein